MTDDWKARIVCNPKVLAGKPTVRGMRLGVEQVIRALAAGISQEELLAEYPDLEPGDFRACLLYAAELVDQVRACPVATFS